MKLLVPLIFGASVLATSASAQTTTPQTTAPPAGSPTTPAAGPAGDVIPGSNSFTEGQAKSRFEDAGFSKITDLKKDDQGIWRAKAEKDGRTANVALDYKGNIAVK